MKDKIRSFINLCKICLSSKYERHPYKIKFAHSPIPSKPLDIFHIDIFISQPDMFLTAVDKLSRFAMIIPLKSRSIVDVKRSLIKLVTTFGTPKLIVCDNELAFKSIEIRGLLQRLDVDVNYTPSNHSEENGIVERFHSTLTEIFLCIKEKYNDLCNKEIYKISTSLYNSTIHSATKLKPIEVFFGIKENDARPLNLELILENSKKLFDEVIVRLQTYQNKSIEKHNLNRKGDPTFLENETIYNKRQGIKDKKKANYNKVTVRENRRKTFFDSRFIRLHKSKVKRKRRT